jgi:hypothetical protein
MPTRLCHCGRITPCRYTANAPVSDRFVVTRWRQRRNASIVAADSVVTKRIVASSWSMSQSV